MTITTIIITITIITITMTIITMTITTITITIIAPAFGRNEIPHPPCRAWWEP